MEKYKKKNGWVLECIWFNFWQAIRFQGEDVIYEAIDEANPAMCVLVDIAKAFDSVCHDELSTSLENMAFRGMI